jgi:hypothetical protein
MSNEMRMFEIPVEEKHRGNFAVHFSFVSNNRSYTTDQSIYVPFENTNLSLEFETFRDKLIPGQQEEWKIKLKGPKGEKVMAEMLAAMYDASLDEFRSNYFSFYLYRSYYSNTYWMNDVQGIVDAQLWYESWNDYSSWVERTYDHLNWFGYYMSYNYRGYTYGWADDMDGDMPVMKNMDVLQEVSVVGQTRGLSLKKGSAAKPAPSPGVIATGGAKDETTTLTDSVADERDNRNEASGEDKEGQSGAVKVRSNLNETVFFFPHLETDSSGAIIIKFTMNEALTKWKFMALAHTKDLKYGFIQKEVVTQ